MKTYSRRIAIFIVIVAIIGSLVWYRSRPQPVEVAVATVESGRVEATVANTRAGTVEAYRRAKVAPTASGQVTKLPVRQGDPVQAGDLLLELRNDDVLAELQVARSRARAAAARADQACVMAASAQREAGRLTGLAERKLVPAEGADKAAAESRSLAAACRAAKADAQLAADQILVTDARLSRTRLAAPFDGVVAEVNAELGEIVSPSPPGIPTPPAVDLVDPSSLYVSAPIDEVDAPKVKLGMPARISLDALPGRRFAGEVTRMAPYVQDMEKQARTVEIHVSFREPSQELGLLPGYSADAEVLLDVAERTLRVPTEAVLDGKRVLVLGADGRIAERAVETGLSNWEWTEVRSGLTAGEQVVLSVNRPGVKAGALAQVEQK